MSKQAVGSVLVVDAAVLTMDEARPRAEAFLVTDGVVSAVGTSAELRTLAPTTPVLDAGGRTVLPGLTDAHAHLELLAYAWHIAVDCRSPRVRSIEDIVALLRERADRCAPGEWILGHGGHFQDATLAERRYPDRRDLDRVSLEHPVVFRSSYHSNVFNSKALELLGVDRDTPDAPGGRIEHDEHGEPTGRTYDMYGELGVPEAPLDELARAITAIEDSYLAYGVTAFGDIPLHPNGLAALAALAADGLLRTRVVAYPKHPNVVAPADLRSGALVAALPPDDGRLRLGGVKVFLDGGLTSSAAALHEPYEGQGTYAGELAFSPEELRELAEQVDAAGLQLSLHAIGDRALDIAIDAIASLPRDRVRTAGHRIEHAGNLFMTPERIARILDAEIVAVPQPAFLLTTAAGYRRLLGPERSADLMPFRRLLDAGLVLPGNSDAIGITSGQHNPFPGMRAAVDRRTAEGDLIDPEQAITPEEALAMYTTGAAAAIGEAAQRGSISVGKAGDFIVLDRDPLADDGAQLAAVRVDETWIGGRRVFRRD